MRHGLHVVVVTARAAPECTALLVRRTRTRMVGRPFLYRSKDLPARSRAWWTRTWRQRLPS